MTYLAKCDDPFLQSVTFFLSVFKIGVPFSGVSEFCKSSPFSPSVRHFSSFDPFFISANQLDKCDPFYRKRPISPSVANLFSVTKFF